MKKQSIHDLWTIKQMVKDCPHTKCGTAIIEKVNKVLLEEGDAEAVLYPHTEKKQCMEYEEVVVCEKHKGGDIFIRDGKALCYDCRLEKRLR